MKQVSLPLICICIVFFGCRPLELDGKVENEKWEPIQNAIVIIKRTGDSAYSDNKGKVHLSHLRVDDTLIVRADGYKTYQEGYEWRRGRQTFVLEPE